MIAQTHRLKGLAGPIVFFVCISIFAGCYTAFRHPGAPDLIGEQISRDMSCYDCHDQAAFYHSYYGVYYDYYDSPWFGYYSDPWWFRSNWYHSDPGAPDPLDTDNRRVWGRGAPAGSARGAQGSTSGPAYLKPGYSQKASKKTDPPAKEKKQTEEKSKSRRTHSRGKKK